MELILTHPKTGSHLLAKILKAKPYSAMNLNATPKDINEVIKKLQNKVKNKKSIWMHYPYNDKLKKYYKNLPNFVNLHSLYRDPRDIICSIHRAIYRQTWHLFLDNLKPGCQLHKLTKQETMEILIDIMLPHFEDYDKWRQTGLFKKHYYREIIKHPVSKTYTEVKIVGVAGNYKEYMTEEQIAKSTEIYADLIKLWRPSLDDEDEKEELNG